MEVETHSIKDFCDFINKSNFKKIFVLCGLDFYKKLPIKEDIKKFEKISELKYFYKKGSKIILQAANQNYDDIIFLCSDDCMKYIWLSYDYMIYKSDAGSINVTPTVRIQNGKYESNHGLFDKDYSRSKYELTINYKFK